MAVQVLEDGVGGEPVEGLRRGLLGAWTLMFVRWEDGLKIGWLCAVGGVSLGIALLPWGHWDVDIFDENAMFLL